MNHRDTDQSAATLAPNRRVGGSTAEGKTWACQMTPALDNTTDDAAVCLMEQVVCRTNMLEAHKRVLRNKGSAGIDGVGVYELWGYCGEHWARIKEELLSGRYKPQAVRQVVIPKPNGGERLLGIPTAIDRLIQQAILQVLQPIFDPHFSEHSYGFRPMRSAQDAVKAAQYYQHEGYRWVVDIDLKAFFDQVNHDMLMARVARRIKDKRVLKVIRGFLQAGVLAGGVVSQRSMGTPQGGPLSPLLSNILLDDWDKELEKRGHRFARYADDCNIYVKSRRAGERVMASLKTFLETRLRLMVNESKSKVDRPWNTKFLGYSFTWHRKAKLKPAPESVKRFKQALKAHFRRGRGRKLSTVIKSLTPMLRGWMNYFRLSEVRGVFEKLDQWLRRRLRLIIWRQCKRSRTRVRMFTKRGFTLDHARQCAYNHFLLEEHAKLQLSQ